MSALATIVVTDPEQIHFSFGAVLRTIQGKSCYFCPLKVFRKVSIYIGIVSCVYVGDFGRGIV